MENIWLKSYPEGIPAEVPLDRFASLTELFIKSCKEYAANTALTNFGCTKTYAELEQDSRDFAAYLQSVCGLKKGDRIAIMLPNVMQYFIAIFGAFRAGLVVVNVNPLYTARELEHQLNDSGATTILVLENVAHVLQKVVDKTQVKQIITTTIGECLRFPKGKIIDFVVKYIKRKCPSFSLPGRHSFKHALGEGRKYSLESVELTQSDIAFLQYTGGTTGVAKGAELSHGNILANVEQAHAWIKEVVDPGKEVVITALPLYHIFSLTANCMMFIYQGANNVLITNPRDTDGFAAELSKYPFTILTGVNTLFNSLLNNDKFKALNFSTLKVTLGGGMAVQSVVAKKWKEVTGCVLAEAYGLTETSPAVMINPVTIEQFNGSIGLPIPSTQIKVINDEGEELPINSPGELCIKGPQVMRGYWNKPDETEKVLDSSGWLKTGDIAKIDEQGFVFIVDRKKDMILVSGFNVFPNEIEDVIAEHEDVLEVAAVGVADSKCGEVVKVFVVSKNQALTAESIIEFSRDKLTAYKVPKFVEFREELPKTNVGKIMRKELREV